MLWKWKRISVGRLPYLRLLYAGIVRILLRALVGGRDRTLKQRLSLLKALVDRAPEKAVNRANGNTFADKNIIAAVSGRNVVFDVIPKNIQASKITI